jgi:hypothetical protein
VLIFRPKPTCCEPIAQTTCFGTGRFVQEAANTPLDRWENARPVLSHPSGTCWSDSALLASLILLIRVKAEELNAQDVHGSGCHAVHGATLTRRRPSGKRFAAASGNSNGTCFRRKAFYFALGESQWKGSHGSMKKGSSRP